MNRYPLWKYIIVAIALVLGFVLFAAGGNFLFDGMQTFADEIQACVTFSTDCGQ